MPSQTFLAATHSLHANTDSHFNATTVSAAVAAHRRVPSLLSPNQNNEGSILGYVL